MTKLKLLTIVTEAALEHQLAEAIEKHGAHGYTITEARGKGTQGIRSGYWDNSANIRVEVLCDTDVCASISKYIFDNFYKNFAMISYSSDVEVLRDNKF